MASDSDEIVLSTYPGEEALPKMMEMIAKDLSEPYSVYTFRFFVTYWPHLSFLALKLPRDHELSKVWRDAEKDGENVMFLDDGRRVLIGDASRKAWEEGELAGCVVCKEEERRGQVEKDGYMGMLVVGKEYRGRGLGRALAEVSLTAMRRADCALAILEVEYSNMGARLLYEKLGFVRDIRRLRYYMNGSDAFHMVLPLNTTV